MSKISDLSEPGKENHIDQLCTIFEEVGVGLDKGELFIQSTLCNVSDRWEINEDELLEFYMSYFNSRYRITSSIFGDELLGD